MINTKNGEMSPFFILNPALKGGAIEGGAIEGGAIIKKIEPPSEDPIQNK